MTEQEVEELAARLTRIWGLDELQYSAEEGVKWTFRGSLSEGVMLQTEYWIKGTGFYYTLFDSCPWRNDVSLMFQCNEFYPDYNQQTEYAQHFISQWSDFFRRGCWLSGCNIEATAHEKAEWIQGFSREEIEAWDLKI